MLTNVLFDFDGPLVDLFDVRSSENATRQIFLIAGSLGLHTSQKLNKYRFMDAWGALRAQVCEDIKLSRTFDRRVHLELKALESSALKANQSFDPISHQILLTARERFDGVAIVSNNSQMVIQHWVSDNGLGDFVDCVVGRRANVLYEHLKPNPFLLRKAIRELGCDPTRAVFIGDTDSDMKCSLRAKTKFVGIRTRHSPSAAEIKLSPQSLWLHNRSEVLRYMKEKKLDC